MRWISDRDRYGGVAIAIHWLTALAVLGLLASGTLMEDMSSAEQIPVLRVHAIMGSAVLVLTLLRLIWWWVADRRPLPATGMPAWQRRLSQATHVVLYLILIIMGVSGISMIVMTGAGEILLGGAAAPLPEFDELPARAAHGLGATAMFVFAGLHIAAALYHQFVRQDRLLGRMGIGKI